MRARSDWTADVATNGDSPGYRVPCLGQSCPADQVIYEDLGRLVQVIDGQGNVAHGCG